MSHVSPKRGRRDWPSSSLAGGCADAIQQSQRASPGLETNYRNNIATYSIMNDNSFTQTRLPIHTLMIERLNNSAHHLRHAQIPFDRRWVSRPAATRAAPISMGGKRVFHSKGMCRINKLIMLIFVAMMMATSCAFGSKQRSEATPGNGTVSESGQGWERPTSMVASSILTSASNKKMNQSAAVPPTPPIIYRALFAQAPSSSCNMSTCERAKIMAAAQHGYKGLGSIDTASNQSLRYPGDFPPLPALRLDRGPLESDNSVDSMPQSTQLIASTLSTGLAPYVQPAATNQADLLAADSKKKKKMMKKKKKMEKKHKEWKKGKKHKKKKYESKKKKGGMMKKKKGKKEKKKWGMEKKGHKKKGNFKKKKWGHKKKMKKGHKKGKKGHKMLKDKGHKKKGFKKVYHKEEWGKKKKWHDIKREKKWNTKQKKWKKKWHQEKGKKYKGKHMKKYHKKNKHGKKYKKEKKSKYKKHKGEKFKKGHKKKKEEYSKKKEGGKKKKMKKEMKKMKKKKG